MEERADTGGWAARPWVMALIGAVAGLLIHWLTDGLKPADDRGLRVAGAAFVGSAATLFAFTYEPIRGRWAAIFALAAGATVGLMTYWNGGPAGWSASEAWRSVCIGLAVAIAAPLFQTARDEGAARFPYATVHGHAWTNVVLWFAAWLFTGIAFALVFLLSALFELIGITVLRDLLRDDWFAWVLGGGAFGAAVGLLRERDRVVVLLQNVAVSILAVLAPVLGAGLLLFLISLIFTGLTPLWEATKATTPILLSCVIAALILANAVVGDGDRQESRSAPLRFGAIALGLAMLPFALIAAVSTGLRIDQYGFTPDRLWALVFVIVASAFGLAYLVALIRKRQDWATAIRPANLKLAFGLCALALFLATPILSFNAISTRDQVARLTSGRISPDRFDWAALAFDFGEPGRAATRALAQSGNVAIRAKAGYALKADNRWRLNSNERERAAIETAKAKIRVLPTQVPLPEGLIETFDLYQRDNPPAYTLIYRPGDNTAVLAYENCRTCAPHVSISTRGDDGIWVPGSEPRIGKDEAANEAARAALARGEVEIRTVARRQLFVGGKPIGPNFR